MILSPVGCANTKYKQRETEKYVLSNILSRTTETPEDQPDPADSSLWTNLSSSSAPALCDHISWELLHDNLHFTLQEYLLYFLPRKVSSYQNVLSSSSALATPGNQMLICGQPGASCPVLRLSELNLSKIYRQLLKFCDISRLCRIVYCRVGIYR